MGKMIKFVKIVHKRKMNIDCLQREKWGGWKARKLIEWYTLLYLGSNETRKEVGVAICRYLKDKIINVSKIEGKIINIKLAIEKRSCMLFACMLGQGH